MKNKVDRLKYAMRESATYIIHNSREQKMMITASQKRQHDGQVQHPSVKRATPNNSPQPSPEKIKQVTSALTTCLVITKSPLILSKNVNTDLKAGVITEPISRENTPSPEPIMFSSRATINATTEAELFDESPNPRKLKKKIQNRKYRNSLKKKF